MLFDLRSRGRRRTVQVVYLSLAIVFGLGLILFGVGTGSGGGGLLNAFTGGGSSNSQNSAISSQEKAALRETRLHPDSAAAWADLVNAHWAAANTSATALSNGTTAFTAQGRKDLVATGVAWKRYLALTSTPDPDVAILAARAYGYLGDYAAEASAWEIEAEASPTQAKGFACQALAAYAAKETRIGDLAKAKALSLTAKSARAALTTAIDAAQTTPAAAQSC